MHKCIKMFKRLITRQINDDSRMRKVYIAICHHHCRQQWEEKVVGEKRAIFIVCQCQLSDGNYKFNPCLAARHVVSLFLFSKSYFDILYLTINSLLLIPCAITSAGLQTIMNVNIAFLFMSDDQRFFIK